jgi:hypothetical protein
VKYIFFLLVLVSLSLAEQQSTSDVISTTQFSAEVTNFLGREIAAHVRGERSLVSAQASAVPREHSARAKQRSVAEPWKRSVVPGTGSGSARDWRIFVGHYSAEDGLGLRAVWQVGDGGR